MDLSKLFDLQYLTAPFPLGFSLPVKIGLLAVFLACIVLAIFAHFKMKKVKTIKQKFWNKIQVWGWSVGIVGLLFVYFRELRAVYLSSRIWLLLWLLIAMIWMILILKFMLTKIPAKEESQKREAEFNKWIPKKK